MNENRERASMLPSAVPGCFTCQARRGVGRAWDAAAANVVLEEQADRLLHRGGGVARRSDRRPAVAPCSNPLDQKLQIFGLNRNNPMTPDGV